MQVLESGPGYALCEAFGVCRRVNMLLIGEQPPGTWVLVSLGSASEVISADEAQQVGDALRALQLTTEAPVMVGNDLSAREQVDALLADLVERGPQKPEATQLPEAKRTPSNDE